MDDFAKVTISGRTYELRPQRIGRIARKLGLIQRAFAGAAEDGEFTSTLYTALQVFIPDLDPEWKLSGYASQEAFDEARRHADAVADALEKRIEAEREEYATGLGAAEWSDLAGDQRDAFPGVLDWDPDEIEPDWVDPYREDADLTPTVPEIADAVEAIYEANGGKRLERLLANLVDPAMIRAMTRTFLVREMASRTSRSAPPPSGESTPTSSGPTEPTPEIAASSA